MVEASPTKPTERWLERRRSFVAYIWRVGAVRTVVEFVRPALLVAWKDVLLELRNPEVVATALVFGVMLVVIFNFALNITPETVDVARPGSAVGRLFSLPGCWP